MKSLCAVSITVVLLILAQAKGYSAVVQKTIELKHPLFEVSYSPTGVTFSPAVEKMDWKWQLKTISGIGALETGPVAPVADGNDIRYHRGAITEQYLFRSFSVEQQFVIPSGERITGDLVIEGIVLSDGRFNRVEGGWNWEKNQGNVFVGDVFVYDAHGKSLQASMAVSSTTTRIIVDYFALKNASFPVTIDPQIGTNDFVLNNDAGRAYQPHLIFNSGTNVFFSSWTKYNGSGLLRNEDIYAGSFTRDQVRATPVTVDQTCNYANFRISKDPPSGALVNSIASKPDVAYCGSNYLTVWEDYYEPGSGYSKRLIKARTSSGSSNATDTISLFYDATFKTSYSSPRYPAVAGNNTKFLVASSVHNFLIPQYNVLGKFVQTDGTPEATAYFPFFSSASEVFTDVDLDARPSGDFVVAASTVSKIYYGRVNTSGALSGNGSLTGLGNVGSVAVSAKDNSNFLMVWSELTGSGSAAKYVIKGSISGGAAFQIDDSSNPNGSGKPSVAYNPDTDSWLVAWHSTVSTTGGATTMVWAREVLSGGTMNKAFPVSKQTRTSVTPDVAYDSQNHEFWIAWSGGGNKDQLLAQRWTSSMSDCIISMKRDTIHENNYKGAPFNPATDKYVTAFRALNSIGDSIYPLDFIINTGIAGDDGTKFQTSYLQASNTQTPTISNPDDYYLSKNKLFYTDNNYINYELKDSYSFSVNARSVMDGTVGSSSSQTQTVRVVDMNEQFAATISSTVTFLEDQVNPKIPFTYQSGDNGLERSPILLGVTVTPTTFVSAPTMLANPSVPNDGNSNVIPRTPLTINENLLFSLKTNVSGTQTLTFTLTDQKSGVWIAAQKENIKTYSLGVTVIPVNDAPTFTAGGDVIVNEDCGTQTITAWAGNINAGAPDESGQTLTFFVSNSNSALFNLQPSLNSTTGDLVFSPAPDQFGTATLTVYLKDNGETANGGVDQSGTVTFTITVNPVNDAPGFTKDADQTVLEDAGTQTVTSWAGSIIAGPSNESSQVVSFTVTNTNNALFTVQPDVDEASGTLTYLPKPNAFGTATVTVVLYDDGGTANGGVDSATQTFAITVLPVNDAPTFSMGSDQTVLEDCGSQTVTAWASGMDPGNSYESSQTVQFLVSNDNTALFSVQPSLDPVTGTLTYTPAANAFGTANVSVWLEDNGGTANGGVNTTASETFTITVAPVNDAPTFSLGANPVVDEDSGVQTVAVWFSGINAGPANENTQTLTIQVTTDKPELFSVQPSVDRLTGDLSFTPAPNAFGTANLQIALSDNGGTLSGGVDSYTQSATIEITSINDSPGFTAGGDQSVPQGSGTQTVTSWATNISAGPANESDQLLTFILSNTNNALFADQPAIDPVSGTLTYTPQAGAFGTATVTVQLKDNGATLNGGVDVSGTATFTIIVAQLNQAPSFVAGADVVVNEDAASQTISWASSISAGPAYESGQSLTFYLSNDNAALFSEQPSLLSSTGALTFKPAPDQFGTATLTVYLKDNGGTANGGVDQSGTVTFTITVNPVNDAPGFTKGADQTVLEDAGTQTVTNWAENIIAGPSNESSQVLSFTVTNTNNALFDVQPDVDEASGTLTYLPKPNAFGTATVTVVLYDDGGTANGGVDSATQTFAITVLPVNDAPTFSMGSDQTVLEDCGSQTVTAWASGMDPGNSYESSQTLQFLVSNDNVALFSVQPSVNPVTGTLTYTPAANAFGTANVSVWLEDNGGTANGGVNTTVSETFTITVIPVNDAPFFTPGNNQLVLEDCGFQTVTAWAADISKGNSEESSQTIQFVATNTNPMLFSSQPAIDELGNLYYTPAANQYGTATITVYLTDNGGTANGGIDASGQVTFTITVSPVNDKPVAVNSEVSMMANGTYLFQPGNFGFTDPADSGDELAQISVVSAPGKGTLLYNGIKVVSYPLVLNLAQISKLSFQPESYKFGNPYTNLKFIVADNNQSQASNGIQWSDNQATLNIEVIILNQPPVGSGQMVYIDENSEYSFASQTFGFSDPDEGDVFGGVKIEFLPEKGQLLLHGKPVVGGTVVLTSDLPYLTYKPKPDEYDDQNYTFFWFRVGALSTIHPEDEMLFSLDLYPFFILVKQINSAPSSVNETVKINEKETYTFSSSDFALIDTQNTGDMLSAVKVSLAQTEPKFTLNGKTVKNEAVIPADSIRFMTFNSAGFNGSNFSFGFQVIDNNSVGGSNGKLLSAAVYLFVIQINPANSAPALARPFADIEVNEFDEFSLALNGTNFVDPDGDLLTYQTTITSGNWLTKSGDTQLHGVPLPDSDAQATVTVRATDPGGLWAEDTFTISIIRKKRPLLYGQLSGSETLPESLMVGLLKSDTAGPETATSTNTGANDYYYFEGVAAGLYVVKAINNQTDKYPTLVSTYYTSTTDWSNATKVDVKSTGQYQANINMLYNQTVSGNGAVSGFVNVSENSSPSGSGAVGNPADTQPLANADVLLTGKGSSTLVLHTQTTSDGSYKFTGLPLGEYVVSVTIPGLVSTMVYTLKVEETKLTFENINFLIYLGDNVITNTNLPVASVQLSLYPNPTTGLINLACSGLDQELQVNVINVNGQVVIRRKFDPQDLIQMRLDDLISGSYLVEVRGANFTKTFQIILMKAR